MHAMPYRARPTASVPTLQVRTLSSIRAASGPMISRGFSGTSYSITPFRNFQYWGTGSSSGAALMGYRRPQYRPKTVWSVWYRLAKGDRPSRNELNRTEPNDST